MVQAFSTTVLPNSVMFAKMIAWAETLVGLGLTFGLLPGSCTQGILAEPELRLGVGTWRPRPSAFTVWQA